MLISAFFYRFSVMSTNSSDVKWCGPIWWTHNPNGVTGSQVHQPEHTYRTLAAISHFQCVQRNYTTKAHHREIPCPNCSSSWGTSRPIRGIWRCPWWCWRREPSPWCRRREPPRICPRRGAGPGPATSGWHARLSSSAYAGPGSESLQRYSTSKVPEPRESVHYPVKGTTVRYFLPTIFQWISF